MEYVLTEGIIIHLIQEIMQKIHIKDLIRGMTLSYYPYHKTVKKNMHALTFKTK